MKQINKKYRDKNINIKADEERIKRKISRMDKRTKEKPINYE